MDKRERIGWAALFFAALCLFWLVLVADANFTGRADVVIELYSDGTWRDLRTPALATATVEPTLYPTPTATEQPALTPTVEPTPTQEFWYCTARLKSGWNVRDAPRGTWLGTTGALGGQTVKFEAKREIVYQNQTELWWAFWWDTDRYGWVIEEAIDTWEQTACDLPTEPPEAARGVWAGPGAPQWELVALGDSLKAAGHRPAATVYGDTSGLARQLYDRGWLVAYRPWLGGVDCANFDGPPEQSARDWVDRAVAASAAVPRSWFVLCNEPVFPSTDYAVRWIEAAITRYATLGQDYLVPVVWPPGHPAEGDISRLAEPYKQAAIRVAWGMNLYPTIASLPLCPHGGMSDYTVWRWERYRRALGPLPLVVTEAARGNGAQVADMADLRCFMQQTERSFLWVTFWYTAGESGLGHWPLANLWGRLAELAGALA